jgi:hypothetical protein
MTRPKGQYLDQAWRGDRPPISPAPGAPLHGDEARRLVRWLVNYAARPPRAPLSPSATYWLKQVRRGEQPLEHRRWQDILDYVVRRKKELGPKTAEFQIRVGGGLTSLIRPRG